VIGLGLTLTSDRVNPIFECRTWRESVSDVAHLDSKETLERDANAFSASRSLTVLTLP